MSSKSLISATKSKLNPSVNIKADARQVKNDDGAFVFTVDDFSRLRRFLIIGTTKNYYRSEDKLSSEAIALFDRCLAEDGVRFVETIKQVSDNNSAPKVDYTLFALAYALSNGKVEKDGKSPTKAAAEAAFTSVVRTGTHMLQFTDCLKAISGRSAVKRRTLASWYLSKDVDKLAYQVLKYANREGWTHRDVLRFVHVKPTSPKMEQLFSYLVNKDATLEDGTPKYKHVEGVIPMLDGVLKVKALEGQKDPFTVISLIGQYNLPHEVLPSSYKNHVAVQAELLKKMPYTATLRNLASYSKSGLLAGNPDSYDNATYKREMKTDESLATLQDSSRKLVVERLQNKEQIKTSRVHPMSILLGLKTYASGHGHRGGSSWQVNDNIVGALDKAFYHALDSIDMVDKSVLIAVDVSPSMDSTVGDTNISNREASAAMAMALMRNFKTVEAVKFAGGLTAMSVSSSMRMDQVLRVMNTSGWGGTNISSVAKYAQDVFKRTGRTFDAIIILTDNDTNGGTHPFAELNNLRKMTGKQVRQVVMAFSASEFTVADPSDSFSMDIPGLDSTSVEVAQRFINGEF